MSKVVQDALRRAVEEKGVELVEDVKGFVFRFRNEDNECVGTAETRISEFLFRVTRAIAAFEHERAEIDTAMQRDRDADT